MRSKSQILSKLRADGHITDEEYKMLKQEPKTGKWIEVMEGNAYRYKCTKCNELVVIANGFTYCPHCGAKMKEG